MNAVVPCRTPMFLVLSNNTFSYYDYLLKDLIEAGFWKFGRPIFFFSEDKFESRVVTNGKTLVTRCQDLGEGEVHPWYTSIWICSYSYRQSGINLSSQGQMKWLYYSCWREHTSTTILDAESKQSMSYSEVASTALLDVRSPC